MVLNGVVDSRNDKRRAEHLVETIPGIEDVHNHLRLRKHIEGWIPDLKQGDAGGKDEKR